MNAILPFMLLEHQGHLRGNSACFLHALLEGELQGEIGGLKFKTGG